MDESRMTGGVPMVKIDGAKVRSLREARGLTQLFLATAVEVTTDTISRWENKRYPTIKRENGLKLAEALEVDLDEILEKSTEEEIQEDPAEREAVEEAPSNPPAESEPKPPRKFSPFIVVMLVLIVLIGWWLYPTPKQPSISATRLLPSLSSVGQAFPVAITVSTNATDPLSLILKETLPEGAKLLASVPPYSDFDSETGEIRWLKKINGVQPFAYMVQVDRAEVPFHFSGTVAVRKGSGHQIEVKGDHRVKTGHFHWADSDGDGRICDEEILVVYDVFSGIAGLPLDIDQVEEIWLGSGYVWNEAKKKFDILP